MITGTAVFNEGSVLAVFLIGLLVSIKLKRRWPITEIITMYALGLLFEILTSHMWIYPNIFLVFPFAEDISVIFPLGWAGMIMTATTMAETLWRKFEIRTWWMKHVVLMLSWWVVGDIAETILYNTGLFDYARDASTELTFILGQVEPLPPTMILVGYGLLQPIVSYYFLWMEKGLAEKR